MARVLVIIPCYNEEKNIVSVVHAIEDYVAGQDGVSIDYIVVNDCSTDNTVKILRENKFNYLNLPINLGIGGCVQAGYLYAREHGYDIAIQHDGDGQHDPRFFLELVNVMTAQQADIVIGSRFIEKSGFQSTRLRRMGIAFLGTLIRLCTGVKVLDVTSGYRAVNRKYIEFFAAHYAQDYPEPESLTEAAVNRAKVVEVPVIMHERKEGKSSISTLKSLYYMLKVSLAILLQRLVVGKK